MEPSDPRLTAFVLGELDEAERKALAVELKNSPELQHEVESIREGVALLAAGLESEPCPALTDDQREAIDPGYTDHDDLVSTTSHTQPTIGHRRSWPLLVAAACVLLLAAILLPPPNWQSRSTVQTTTPAQPVEDSAQFGNPDKAHRAGLAVESNGFKVLFADKNESFDKDMEEARDLAESDSEEGQDTAAEPDSNESEAEPFSASMDRGGGGLGGGSAGGMDMGGGQEMDGRVGGKGRDMGGHMGGDMGGMLGGMSGRSVDDGNGQLGGGRPARDGETRDRLESGGRAPARGFQAAADDRGDASFDRSPADRFAPSPVRTDPSDGRLGDDRFNGSPRADAAPSHPEGRPGLGASGRAQPEEHAPDGVADPVQIEINEPLGVIVVRGHPRSAEKSGLTEEAETRALSQIVEGESLNRDETLSQLQSAVELSEAGAVRAKPLRTSRQRPRSNLPSVRAAGQALDESRDGKSVDGPVAAELATPQEAQPEARTAKKQRTRNWRRAQATPNASRLMVGDRDELAMEGMQVNVLVDGFRARVLLDLYYFNDRSRRLEGNFKLRLPNEASLYYFAFGESAYEYRPQVDQLAARGFLSAELVRAATLNPAGIRQARAQSWSNVKEARLVPRGQAAHAYSETVRRRVDPALVEWSGAGVFNARVFPLMPHKLHRIVVGYDVTLQQHGDELSYRLDLPAELKECFVDLNVAAVPGMTAEVTPRAQPFLASGRAYYRFANPGERAIEVRLLQPGHVLLAGKDEAAGDVFATRVTPALPADEKSTAAPKAIFLVDTSLSSRPERFNVWLDLLEQVLRRNRDSMHEFAVLFFNIESHWWQESFVKNTPDQVDRLLTYCRSLSLEGATDLRQALRESSAPSWIEEEDGPISVDRFLLSDGAATWGETELARISDALSGSNSGALFAYQTGATGTATGVLAHLARETGGAVFSVAAEDEIPAAARAHRQRPWRLLDVSAPGGSDLLVAGRPQFVYPGQSLLVVGRGQVDGDVTWRVRRGDEERVIRTRVERVIESELAPRLYGQVSVGQLEDLGADVEDVAVAYARHFRVTGRSCSLLMLESEADYQRFNIKPEDDAFVVRSSPSAILISQKLAELAERLADAKGSLTNWLSQLEKTPGMQFKLPTALRLAIERMPSKSFEVDPAPLVCKQRLRGGVTKKYLEQLDSSQLDYDSVSQESLRRFGQRGAADALRALSNLIESNPGNPVLTRDVAFSAIEWGLPGHAYPLLKRVAMLRPYEPQTYQAMAHCLAESDRADLAMIFYEVALHGRWHERYRDINQIVAIEYLDLLRRIQRGQLSSQVPDYVRARLDSLAGHVPVQRADLIVTMMWNTDRTDVDLHVVEPTGEECFYEHPRTRIGGQITRDVTQGFGPEMYTLVNAKPGSYQILANYFGNDANRTQVRSKVYVTVYEDFGGKRQRISKRTVTLSDTKEKRELAQVKVGK